MSELRIFSYLIPHAFGRQLSRRVSMVSRSKSLAPHPRNYRTGSGTSMHVRCRPIPMRSQRKIDGSHFYRLPE
jgi:hypothetical protein